MSRVGLVSFGLAAVAAVPAFIVESETAVTTWTLIAASFAVVGFFAFAHKLLEKIAPAEPEEGRTHFNPRDPGAAGPPVQAKRASPRTKKAA